MSCLPCCCSHRRAKERHQTTPSLGRRSHSGCSRLLFSRRCAQEEAQTLIGSLSLALWFRRVALCVDIAVYSLISRDVNVLAEQTATGLSGNFAAITRVLLKKIPAGEDGKMSYAYDQYIFHYSGQSTRARRIGASTGRTSTAASDIALCDRSCVCFPNSSQKRFDRAMYDRERV